ncbi:MAG: ShlB/FhaC/HecB family hemolysin secretion/activation protein [Synechococcus sp.]
MRDITERSRLRAALLLGSALGVGQLSGVFLPAQAQGESGLQQNKREQELLRERLDRRQRELQKPVPVVEPDQAPETEPGVDETETSTEQSRCDPELFRVHRISLIDGDGKLLALDCQAPEQGFFSIGLESRTGGERRFDGDRGPGFTCRSETTKVCNQWRELNQIRLRLLAVRGLEIRSSADGQQSGQGPEPSIAFAVAEPAADATSTPVIRPLKTPLPEGLQRVQKRIVQEISNNNNLFLGRELSQDALRLVYNWLREAQKPPQDGRVSPPLEERWRRWLAERPSQDRPALRNAKGLMDRLTQINLDALGAEGYLGKARLPILNFAWGELRVTRLSTLLSRFGELKADSNEVCLPPELHQVVGTAASQSRQRPPIAWDWAKQTVATDLASGSLFRVDKLSSAVLKLNELGGVDANACIRAGSTIGTSDVLLSLRRTPVVKADVQLDNYVVRYTGPYEIQGSLGLEGAFRYGERINLSAGYSGNVNWYGSRQLGVTANVPITPGGLNVVAALNWADYRSLEQFTADHYTGFYRSGSLGLNQVLWRRPRSGLSARLVGSLNHYEDSAFNAITYDDRTTAVGRLSLLGDFQDRVFGEKSPSYNAAQLAFSFGELSRSPQYASYFPGDGGALGKVNLSFNRLQTFAELPRFSLGLQGQVQLAFSNLNVAEELSLGWPNGVRAYPPGEALGDSGVVGQLTARYDHLPDRRNPGDRRRLAFKAFLDGGYVWRRSNPSLKSVDPLELGLWGPGVGLEWGRDRDYSVSIDLAWPLGQNRARQNRLDVDGLNPEARLWVGVRKWL